MIRLRNHPFLLLGLVTVVIGATYHRYGIDQSTMLGRALHDAVFVLGFIFINLIRVMTRLIGNPALAGLASTIVGLIPYAAADWLLHRWRLRRAQPRAT